MKSLSLSSFLRPPLLPPSYPSLPPPSPATSIQLSTRHFHRPSPSYFVVSASASPPKVVVTRERGKNSKLIKALVRTTRSPFITYRLESCNSLCVHILFAYIFSPDKKRWFISSFDVVCSFFFSHS